MAILGFAFKANTNDVRESPAIRICKDLLEEGCYLNIFDPKVNELQIKEELGVNDKVGCLKQIVDLGYLQVPLIKLLMERMQ